MQILLNSTQLNLIQIIQNPEHDMKLNDLNRTQPMTRQLSEVKLTRPDLNLTDPSDCQLLFTLKYSLHIFMSFIRL